MYNQQSTVTNQVAQAAIYGYTAYAASKWAIRGLAESLQMELRPFNILVAVSYPPDTDTPGYAAGTVPT
jgi:3-dehydrosphinganine reductase